MGSMALKTILGMFCAIVVGLEATAKGACLADGVQSSGAVYRICLPEGNYNGDLVIYAHGYVSPKEPAGIPESHLTLPDGTSIPQIVNALGYAFATTGYSRNGLAVREGLADVVELVSIFEDAHGAAGRVYLAGVSEGGLIAALGVERFPHVFDGGLAACGPIGDFRAHVQYLGDVRILFDYLFPGMLGGSATVLPAWVMNQWSMLEARIGSALRLQRARTWELLRVAKIPFVDFDRDAVDAVTGILWYNVFATNDAAAQLDGSPFDNTRRRYTGSTNDELLNWSVPRFAAHPAAVMEMVDYYSTSGVLARPLVTLHTSHDPIVPVWHEALYSLKVAQSGSSANRVNLIVSRYGHCRFQAIDVLIAFGALVQRVSGAEPENFDAVVLDAMGGLGGGP